jgi:hypothetical protein
MADNNQFISQFDMIGGESGHGMQNHSNVGSSDPLIDNAYAHSLLPQSRHPLFELCARDANIYIQQLWQITSTSCPTSIALSTNWLQYSHELVFYVYYGAENQLAFIKFDMLTGKFKTENVLKEVKCIASMNLLPQFQSKAREEISFEAKQLMSRVQQVDGELGIVLQSKLDEIVVYKGMDIIAKIPVEQLSVGATEVQKGSQIQDLRDSQFSHVTVDI